MPMNSGSYRPQSPSSRPAASSDFEEPPIREEFLEPPIQTEEPPMSQQEIDAAAADELLRIAAEEERDLKNVRKNLQAKDTFVVTCPKGCKIRVKEQHRGRVGKCPRCHSDFIVPKKAATGKG
ncbi:hypothetical protein [Schlesneria sp. DSM 10557]|uniref:hypothetical protein n=1 Tax=Schlesneria sp. DSM 10557 TaxID=3044399 RepID=UPI0035A1C7D5